MDIHNADAVPKVEANLINTVREERLGVVLHEKQLEEFFSRALSLSAA